MLREDVISQALQHKCQTITLKNYPMFIQVGGVFRRLRLPRRLGGGIGSRTSKVGASKVGSPSESSLTNKFGGRLNACAVRSITEGINVLLRCAAVDFSRSFAPFLHSLKFNINKSQLGLN